MASDRIESPRNPRVKALVRLRERRERERSGTMLIEGTRELLRALEAGVDVREAYLCPPLLRGEGVELPRRLAALGIPVVELTRDAFARASGRQGPDGVLALAGTPAWRLDWPSLPRDPLLLVLDGIQKPGNLGAALRTAEAAGADAVVVTGEGTDLANPQVVRASMGSVFAPPVAAMAADALREGLRSRGVRIVATLPSAALDYWDAPLTGAVAVVVGAEHAGLSASWAERADARLRIPMTGLADSLNAATTAALVLYEAKRQRRPGDAPG